MPARFLRFGRQLPVGQPQYTHRHNFKSPLNKQPHRLGRKRPIHLPLHRGGFLEAHGRTYGYIYCVSPVSKLPTKPESCRFPILRCRFCSALPIAPLRKGSCRRSRLRGRKSLPQRKPPPLAPLRKGSWRRSRLRGRFRQNVHDGRPMVAPTGIVGTKINNVGAGIARPFFTVWSAASGRATAIYASAQF